MIKNWTKSAILLGIFALGLSIGQWTGDGVTNEANAQVSDRLKNAKAAASGGSQGGYIFPMTIYSGPNRTVNYSTQGQKLKALNVAEVTLYPGVMVFKDNRDVIGGVGTAGLGEFQIIVGQ
jgi:hypothetical protein